jgi:hypothetical protein
MPVIRNPDSTKNTSTPTNPADNVDSDMWNTMTNPTANARRASMSDRCVFAVPFSLNRILSEPPTGTVPDHDARPAPE